jgi:hypothetical protein
MLGHRTPLITSLGRGCPPVADVERLLAPSATTRVRARLRHARLDRRIAAGADLATSPLLAARAAQLVSPDRRARIAEGLEHAAHLDEACGSYFRTLPRREAIRENRKQLIELAAMLRDDRVAYARGVALLELVLTDGAGPAYTDRCGTALGRQLRLARDSLGR